MTAEEVIDPDRQDRDRRLRSWVAATALRLQTEAEVAHEKAVAQYAACKSAGVWVPGHRSNTSWAEHGGQYNSASRAQRKARSAASEARLWMALLSLIDRGDQI